MRAPWIRTRAEGRGRNYTFRRGVVESLLRPLYRGDWPARVWACVGGQVQVRVVHHEVRVTTPHAGSGRRLRIGFASDLHLGPTTPWKLLEHSVAALNALEPDVILLGGDFVFLDASPETGRQLTRLLRALGPAAKFAVLGNHDLWTLHRYIEDALQLADVELLGNRSARLAPPHDDVVVCGIDDPWTGFPDPERAVPRCNSIKIGLCHSPDGVPNFLGRGVALMLCGHTHGGQIALPGGRPIVLPPGPYSQRMAAGRFQVDDLTVLVSKGVGTTELPIRTFAQPEIFCVDLVTCTP